MLKFSRKVNDRTKQGYNSTWVFGEECDRVEVFGASLTLPEPERKTCNDGKLHYTTYLEKKDKYKEVPQGQVETPALKGTEQQLVCCDRTFRFRSQLDRHTVICQSTRHKRKPKSAAPTRKRGKMKPRRSRGVRPSAAPAEDSIVDALDSDVGSDEGDSSEVGEKGSNAGEEGDETDEEGDEADEFASLVQQFTFHKGEKVRVWWESEGV